MYFPYLRGRQNELICLRELLELNKISDKIIPIIEPVRFNSTLISTISKFVELKRNIIIISNSKVGTFDDDYKKMSSKISIETDSKKKNQLLSTVDNYKSLLDSKYVLKAYLSDDLVVSQCVNGEIDIKNIVLINKDQNDIDYYEENGSDLFAKYTVIPMDEDFKDEVYGDVIALDDSFKKAKRNIDYIENADEAFSRNHLKYFKKGYIGFSDYSIVGAEFDDSGFAPLAVAIHILYFGKKGELRIHHFVSDSNENISDPARKFEEAMAKLISWESFELIPKTYGLNCLIDYYKNGKFPGLGVVKKCSIMHHIEMINNYLGE